MPVQEGKTVVRKGTCVIGRDTMLGYIYVARILSFRSILVLCAFTCTQVIKNISNKFHQVALTSNVLAIHFGHSI